MKRLSLIALVAAFVVSAFAFLASSAFAIPVFARKYNTQCNMCHTVPPRLNKFGVAFKENGFELPPGTVLPESEVYGNQVLSNDEPKAIVGAGFPFMIRTGLTVDLSGSSTTGGATTNQAFLGATVGEFGLIGAGSMETSVGGLGFWIDAPGGAIGAIDFDFNFNPMFKVAVGTDGPKAGYALALTPIYVGANTRNPATATAMANGFNWGNSGQPAIEVRGTTNPSTGLGLNYAVGYLINGAKAMAAGANASSGVYGHVAYYIDAANLNLGVGYATQTNGTANQTSETSLLVDAAYGIGENFMVMAAYNSITPQVATGVTANAVNYLTVQPEFIVSPELAIGGRYVSAQSTLANSPQASLISVGVNYKLLQNILTWVNYTSGSNTSGNNVTTPTLNNSYSGAQAGIDFIF